jgi:glycosyltransferase involved in cell wall biosynthesis
MTTIPKVSILMANYNNGCFIKQAIESVILQTYGNLELIIVDDCSTEDTASIINSYLESYSSKILFYQNKSNLGYGGTLSACAKYATGDYLAIVDPDDCIEPFAVSTLMEEFKMFPNASLVYSTMYMCDQDLNVLEVNKNIGAIPIGRSYQTIKSEENHHIMHFRILSKKAYLKAGGFNTNFKKAIDKDIIYKLEELGDVVFKNVPLYFYRQHSGSISLFKNKWMARWWEIRAKELAYKRRLNTNIPNLTREQIDDLYLEVYKQLCFEALEKKQYLCYLKLLINLFRVNNSLFQTLQFAYYSYKKSKWPQLFSKKSYL